MTPDTPFAPRPKPASGTGQREAALVVQSPNGTTLVLNDLIFDLPTRPGMKGWLFEKLGMMGKEPHIPPLVRMREEGTSR